MTEQGPINLGEDPGVETPSQGGSLLDSLLIEDDETERVESAPNHKVNKPTFKERVFPGSPDKAPKAKRPAVRVAVQKKDEFVEPLTELYTFLGMALTPFDPVGPVIIGSAENCARSLNDLAEVNPSVRKALRSLTQGSAWGAVIFAHAPIMVSLATNHMPGAIPKSLQSPQETEEDKPS